MKPLKEDKRGSTEQKNLAFETLLSSPEHCLSTLKLKC